MCGKYPVQKIPFDHLSVSVGDEFVNEVVHNTSAAAFGSDTIHLKERPKNQFQIESALQNLPTIIHSFIHSVHALISIYVFIFCINKNLPFPKCCHLQNFVTKDRCSLYLQHSMPMLVSAIGYHPRPRHAEQDEGESESESEGESESENASEVEVKVKVTVRVTPARQYSAFTILARYIHQ